MTVTILLFVIFVLRMHFQLDHENCLGYKVGAVSILFCAWCNTWAHWVMETRTQWGHRVHKNCLYLGGDFRILRTKIFDESSEQKYLVHFSLEWRNLPPSWWEKEFVICINTSMIYIKETKGWGIICKTQVSF